MIRCIQVGRSTIQGPLSAGPYPDPSGEHGTILSMGRVVMGRLTESKRAAEPRMTNGIPALFQSGSLTKQARYGADEIARIKEWMTRDELLTDLARMGQEWEAKP